jgi:Photosynthetic reaction centre cytochrome C subunit
MLFNRKLMVMGAMTAVVISAVAFTTPLTEDPGFKNLKVLPKDIDHDKLIKVMREFNDALGVKCNFCHAPSKDTANHHPDFVSDEKPEKNIARSMMRMTVKINKKFFGVKTPVFGDPMEVSCATCHHGSPHPQAQAENKENQGPPPPPREEKH